MPKTYKKIDKDVNEVTLNSAIKSITEKIITEGKYLNNKENTESTIVKRIRKLREKRENKLRQKREQLIEQLQEIYLKEKT